MNRFKVVAIVFILIQSFGCETEIGPFPIVPQLKLTGVERVYLPDGKDSLIVINFSFTDGDGDIGLSDADTGTPYNIPPYNNNLIVGIKAMNNGVLDYIIDPINNDTINNSTRVPILTPPTKNKAIDGTFSLGIPVTPMLFAQGVAVDSIRFELFLYDRALNKSNVIVTDVLKIDR